VVPYSRAATVVPFARAEAGLLAARLYSDASQRHVVLLGVYLFDVVLLWLLVGLCPDDLKPVEDGGHQHQPYPYPTHRAYQVYVVG
jgi:hypothetical protein